MMTKLFVEQLTQQLSLKWSLIKSIENGKTAIYLYLDTNMGIIIPKRYFSNNAEQQLFLELVNGKINTAKKITS